MQRLRHNVSWIRWTPLLAPAVIGIALLPGRTQAQAPVPERKAIQKEEPPKTTPDQRVLQLGGYTLKLVEPDRGHGVQVGGQFGARPFQSNTSLSLDISAAKPDDMLVILGVDNLHGVDDKGRPFRGPDGFFAPPMMSRFNIPDGVRREALPLQTENGATVLKTLEGNLILDAGAVRTLTFAGEDLHFDTSKKAGGGSVTLDFFKQYSDNEVRIFFTWVYPRVNQPFDPQAPRRPMVWNNQQFTVEMIGTDGVTYKNGGRGENGHDAPSPGLSPDPSNPIPVVTTHISHIDCSFQRLPDGVKVKSIICRVVEQGVGTKSVPFKFTDVPILPDKL